MNTEKRAMDDAFVEDALEGVAIIGMAGRFPRAGNLDEYWRNLRDGRECVSFFTDEELSAAGVPAEAISAPNYVKAGAVLDDIELFDASFFGFSPREAEIMDPQLRLFLECAWEALENAGYDSERHPGPIGIYGGMHMSKYLLSNILPNRQVVESAGQLQIRIWNDKDFLVPLVAYKMNLRGPSVTVQTACSTSLIAVCLAAQSLLSHQCDMALAGGVTISIPHRVGSFVQEGVLSPDGHCRAFDAAARGTVGGNGVGIVVLKRLADAVADGDNILAVVKGSAMNNDGSHKIGYTAPSLDGQLEVIGMAQALADAHPDTISYIETHGTGTPLGDPIEVAALTEVFRAATARKNFCAIGSVKTNIGHLDAAAGVASLIKTVLALGHGQLPPSINFESPNPAIDFANSPFYVNARLSEWRRNGAPRRAGVSSFAMGGVNAHVVLEEAPPTTETAAAARPYQLLLLSAKTASALETATKNLGAHLKQRPAEELPDTAYTLQIGRRAFSHRRVLVCEDSAGAASALEMLDPSRVFTAFHDARRRPVIMMFAGQGAQYVEMAAGLYRDEPTFRARLDLCAEILKPRLGADLRELLFPDEESAAESAARLGQTLYTQPALFAVEYALAELWAEWGVEPQMMIGHSIGEYVAACVSGVFSLEDALGLVAERARLMQRLPGGAMLAISLAEEEVRALLSRGLSLAAVNAPEMCVVSGLTEMVEALEERLKGRGVECRRLHTSHAFHSEMVEPILAEFVAQFERVKLNAPTIPYVSNVTGKLVTNAEATDPAYWAKHLRQTVRFSDGLEEILRETNAVLIEVGPGRVLTTFARRHPRKSGDHVFCLSLRHPQDAQPDVAFLLNSLGRLWLAGVPVDWDGFNAHERRRRLPLPTYPFERQRYWIEPPAGAGDTSARQRPAGKRLDMTEWFYTPLWKQSVEPEPSSFNEQSLRWLIFEDDAGLGARLGARLRGREQQVAFVRKGRGFARTGADAFTLDPRRHEDYEALLSELGEQPQRIVHLWSLTDDGVAVEQSATGTRESFRRAQDEGFYSLLSLAGTFGEAEAGGRLSIVVLTNGVSGVAEDEPLSAEKATLLGVAQAITRELPGVACRVVDVAGAASWESARKERLLERLVGECASESNESAVAYRGGRRWVQTFEAVALTGAHEERTRLRVGGAYALVGDLTRGIALASGLARHFEARIGLVVAPDFPARDEWESRLAAGDGEGETSRVIKGVLEIEASGGVVALTRADASSRRAMDEALGNLYQQFGELHGVVYGARAATGEAATRSLRETGRAECEMILETTAAELSALGAALKERQFDFCLLQSSTLPVAGVPAHAAHAAAAHLLAAFAVAQNKTGAERWVSVSWGGGVSDAEQAGGDAGAGAHATGKDRITTTITTDETFQALRRVLSTELAQLVVSPIELEAMAAPPSRDEALSESAAAAAQEPSSAHQRPELRVNFVAPRDEDEERLASIWKRVLGFEQVGIHDDFFDLGGHSLLATQLISRVRDDFNVSLPLETLFETPTVAGMVERVRAAGREQTGPRPEQIQRAPRDGSARPLSFAQQRMWFFDQWESRSAVYNIPGAFRLGGPLNVEALAQSLNEIARRHEVLRTAYVVSDGQPAQVFAPESGLTLQRVELGELQEAEREGELQRIATREAQRPFDLAAGPLMRATLLRLKEDDHVLLLTLHHIVADAWSFGVLYRELGVLYQSFSEGKPSPLAELPFQYADFARWQREAMQGEKLEEQLSYWKQQLGQLGEPLALPTDRPRPARQTFRGATKTFTVAPKTFDALQALNRREGTTLFMLLLAAYQTLLFRYTAQEEIVTGTPIANRNRSEIEGLIGFFVNTLPMRTDLAGDPAFTELLARVREVALGAYAHQDLPFELLVEALQLERDLSRSALFQTMLILQNAPLPEQQLTELSLSPVTVDRQVSMFDLTLYFAETEGTLSGTVEYNTDLFDEGTVERLIGHFTRLLESIVAAPETRIGELQILPEAERERLLVSWNETAAEYPRLRCLHELLEEQARRTPYATAVSHGADSLTYRQLDARSNRLAQRLRRLGVGPDVLVGVLLERSVEMLVALLGVLKAGGAYVPLDPAYPRERIAYMLEDAAAPILITEAALAESLPAHRAKVILLDAERESTDGERAGSVARGAASDNLAYVIYTSGSTGRPKGVQITHRTLVNFLCSMLHRPGLAADDVLLAVTSLSFDIAALELFLPLLVGARVELAGREEAADGPRLAARLAETGATVMQATPATWRLLLDAGRQVGALKCLCGGEAMPVELAARLAGAGGELWNMYGPTETTVWSGVVRVGEEVRGGGGGVVPVGGPVANTQLYVLDGAMRPTPVGVAGELYIGGDGLARGYLNRPALTAERFVPDPHSGEAGARLYRTGDLTRYLADGRIEFLGRLDNQVKIRGFRIELGEIESALRRHASVSEAVVAAREAAAGDARLAAYVVAGAGEEAAAGELRAYLKERLPEYMIPSVFVMLDALPLTPNGKIDRKALPAPESGAREADERRVAPRGPVEEVLCGVWSEVLGIGSVGIGDNFFELGGHSLLAAQVVSRVSEAFQVELPLRALFEAPTVGELAARVEAERAEGGEAIAPPRLAPADRGAHLPLSIAQHQLWFLHQLEPSSTAYHIPVGVRLSGKLDVAALERSVSHVVGRQESLRTTFSTIDGEPEMLIHDAPEMSLPVTDLGGLSADERETEIARRSDEEAHLPFDLARGPLMRARLLKLGDEEHHLVVTMHHIISDGWSLGVLVEEVAQAYEAFGAGREPSLAPLGVQYADYAMWQRGWLRGEALESQLDYWRVQLAGAPTSPELPTDMPRPAVQRFEGGGERVRVEEELTAELRRLSRQQGVTLFMTLLAAFKAVLHYYSGREEIVVGTDIAGRRHVELEKLIGLFVNSLVLRTSLAGDPSFAELLRRARAVTLEAYAHADVPFGRLVEELQPERSLSYMPLFQVAFSFQNYVGEAREVSGLSITPVEVESRAVKFDMVLNLTETAGGVIGVWRYNTELFHASTAARLVERFQTLLRLVAVEPETRLSEIVETLAGEDRRRQAEKEVAYEKSLARKLTNIRRRPAREETVEA